MSSDEATELRIAIGRVLERWHLDQIESAEQQPERAALLAAHIAEIKRAVTPRSDRELGGQRWLGTATHRTAARELAAVVARTEHRRGCMCSRCDTEMIGGALLSAAARGRR